MSMDSRVLAFVKGVGADVKVLFSRISQKADTSYVDNGLNSLRNELRGGAGAALDTFKEVEDALNADQTATAAMATAIGNRVRYDAPQTLTAAQMRQACDNIGIGDYDQDLLAAYNAAKA